MSKATITLSVDMDLKEHFSNVNLNLSGLVNDFLRSYIEGEASSVNALNVEIQRKELEKWSKRFIEASSKIKALQANLHTFDSAREEEAIERLKLEKENIEKRRRCETCGKPIDNPITIKGKIHYKCIDCVAF